MTFKPEGWSTVTPRIFVDDPRALVDFMVHVFGCIEEIHTGRHTVLTTADSKVMISGTDTRAAMPAFLYVYVKDTESVYRRALAAGARTVEKPSATPYGDHRCMIEDLWG